MNLRNREYYLIALAIWINLFGCGSSNEAQSSCPPNSESQQALGHKVVQDHCLACHSSTVKGPARNSAPEHLNYDDLSVVRAEAEDISDEVENGEMPPSPRPKLTETEKENLRTWLTCGAAL